MHSPRQRVYGAGTLLIAAVLAGSSIAHADDDSERLDLHLGGYIQPGYVLAANSEFDQNDQDGFEFSNARFTGAGTRELNDEIEAGFKFNFDVNQGNFAVRDVYGTLSYLSDLVAVDVGQLKTSLSLALMQSEAYLQLPRSPQLRQLSFGRDLGVRVRSEYYVKKAYVRWSGTVANGEGGFRQRRNLDNEYVFTGRVDVAPLGKMSQSEADLEDSELKFAIGAGMGYTPELNNALGLGDVGAKEHRYGFDARLHWRGLSVKAEGLLGDRGLNETSDGFWRYAAYVQAGYVLPWRTGDIAWEPVMRIEQLDINRDTDGLFGAEYTVEETEVRTYEVGVSSYIVDNQAKVHLTYRRTDLLEGPVVDRDGGPLLDDRIFLFMQVGWL